MPGNTGNQDHGGTISDPLNSATASSFKLINTLPFTSYLVQELNFNVLM